MNDKYIPESFTPELIIKNDKFVIKKLTVNDAEEDFKALMSSKTSLRKIFAENDDWPSDNFTIEENIRDLKWHQEEFDNRSSFSYTVLEPNGPKCLGCIYILPWESKGYDSSIYYWVTDDAKKCGLETDLRAFIDNWIKSWPLKSIAFPGREISWKNWDKIKGPKYD